MTESDISVLVVDDHPMFREGLRFTLSQAPGIRVAGEAGDGGEAIALAERLRPAVVVMDIGMPNVDGLTATAAVTAPEGGPRVLVLTMHEDDVRVQAALRAGASGYLLKGAGPEELVSAIRAVHSGNSVLGRAVAARLAGRVTGPSAEAGAFPQLSAREREVLEHLAEGRSNAEIARVLVISPVTVRNHVSNILTKLGAANRRELMVRVRGTPPSGPR